MILSNTISLYIPEKTSENKKIPHRDILARIIKRYLSNKFGGYSSTNLKGGWVLNTGELQEEEIEKIYAFCKSLKLSEIKDIIKLAIRLKRIMKQESFLIEYNNKAILN